MNPDQYLAAHNSGAIIAAFLAATRVQINPHPQGRGFVILPDAAGAKVEYIEQPALPPRAAGTVTANDTASFITAVQRHGTREATVLYASLAPAQFIAVLNDHGSKGKPHWRDHRVAFTLGHSKEYLAWHHHNGHDKTFTQEKFAYFIEDNLPDFKSPEGAKMLDIALNFRAQQQVAYKGVQRLQNGSVDISYSETTTANAGEKKVNVPERFKINLPIWAGLNQKKYDIDARLRYRVAGGALALWYELERPHVVVERAFADELKAIKDALTEFPVIFGQAG